MYTLMSKISQIISNPISEFLNAYEHAPLIMAILLGLIGALAPCQITGNMSAITFYGNRTMQIVFFIVGKVIVFSLLGFFAWIFGQSFETKMTVYFPIFRQAIGPIMIITGLVLIGIFKIKFLNRISSLLPTVLKEGEIGSLLMGASFSLAFCPTMFVLFFVWLMPTVASTSYGLVLPAIFGVATSVPLLIMLALIHFFYEKRVIIRFSMRMGRVIQNVAGVILIIIGVTDTITYWALY